MNVPPPVVEILAAAPVLGRDEQAIPLVTVDDGGHPHVCLVSRAELDADDTEIRAAIASKGTRRNLESRGRATIVVVEGTTAHYCKLSMRRSISAPDLFGAAFELVEHKADSLGIPLRGMIFPATPEVARMERWDRSAEMLAAVAASADPPQSMTPSST